MSGYFETHHIAPSLRLFVPSGSLMMCEPIQCTNSISLSGPNFRKSSMTPRPSLPNSYVANSIFFRFGRGRIFQSKSWFNSGSPTAICLLGSTRRFPWLSCRMATASFVLCALLRPRPLFHFCTPSTSVVSF
jgi:hypothetical protein